MTPLRLAVLLIAIAAAAAWQVTVIPQSLMQMTVGPVLVPAVVAGGLGVLALLYGWSAWRGRQVDESHTPGQEPLPGSLVRLASLLGGGIVFMAGVGPLGFVLPAALCGMGVARAFDAPLGWRSAGVCGAIAAVFWLVFAQLLGIGLGPALRWPF
jgi:hypothetical protein